MSVQACSIPALTRILGVASTIPFVFLTSQPTPEPRTAGRTLRDRPRGSLFSKNGAGQAPDISPVQP
jgi:hypothetical protein